MNVNLRVPLLRLFVLTVVLTWLASSVSRAAEAVTGSIRGRVLHASAGQYVYNAQIRVIKIDSGRPIEQPELASLAVSTDELGYFRLHHVPAGLVTLRVFHTGLVPVEVTVRVDAGGETEAEVGLKDAFATEKDEAVVLDAFTVAVSREMSATALAVNSQRFSQNTKSVIATDELGFIGDGSIGAAMKFLPGVDLEPDDSGFANGITLSGAPSANVPVTSGGFDLVTSATASINSSTIPQRTTQLMQVSLTNISRIEINRSPTPDTAGSALAGSVNLVPKSAFERTKPFYDLQVFGTANENDLSLREKSGPFSSKEYLIYPGVNFSAIVPLSKQFGFTITLNHNRAPKSFDQTVRDWTANWDLNNGTYKVTPNNPSHYMLYQYALNTFQSIYTRNSINLTGDYRLSSNDTLSLTYSQSYNELESGQRQVRWTIGKRPADLDLTASTLTSATSVAKPTTNNTVVNNTYYVDNVDRNRQFQLKYRHQGQTWTGELGASHGEASRQSVDLERGFIFSSLFNLFGTSIRLDDIQPWAVGTITASRNGLPVTPLDLNTFTNAGGFTNTIAGTSPPVSVTSSLPPLRIKPVLSSDYRGQAFGNLSRTFNLRFPLALKVGFDVSDYRRDQKVDPIVGSGKGWIYNGTDVSLTQFINPEYSTPLPGGVGVPSSMDNRKLAQFLLQNWGKLVQLNPGEDRRTAISNSQFLQETITAGYVRFDSWHFKNRLWLVYGLRYERTTDRGDGPYSDATPNYRRNAAGQFVDANGLPVAPGKTPALIYPSGSVEAINATWFERQAHARKNYDNFFPSLNANCNLTEDMVARASYSQTVGRPDLANITPGITLPDLSRVPSPTDGQSQIRVNNPNVRPWTSQNVSLSLEYYSKNLGDITLRGYRRWMNNAFTNQVLPPSDAQPYLELYSVDETLYPTNYVSTLVNIGGTIVTSGLELSGRYSLDAMLPAWARGIQVKFGVTRSTISGGGTAATAFAAQNLYLVPYSVGAGVSLTRKRFSIGLNGKWNARQRLGYINPADDLQGIVDPDTYEYNDAVFRIDLDATVRLGRDISLFVNGRDINGYTQTLLRYSPNTPDLAKGAQRRIFQPVWTAGIRAVF